MRKQLATATAVGALLVVGWFWSRPAVEAPRIAGDAPSSGGASDPSARHGTHTGTEVFAVAERRVERHAANTLHTEDAAPPVIAPERFVVVQHGTQIPIEDASVGCIDSRGLTSELTVTAGTFEPIGTAPFVLEVAAPAHSTRWVVLKDATPAHVDLWRAGSVEVLVVDEAENPLEGVRVSISPEISSASSLYFVQGAFRPKSKTNDRVSAVTNLVRRHDGSEYDHYGPRTAFSIGPASDRYSRVTDATGLARFDGLPANTRFGAQTALADILGSEPEGERRARGSQTAWHTQFADVAVDRPARFRLVRRGSSSIVFDLVGRAPVRERDAERVRLRRKDDANDEEPWVRVDYVTPTSFAHSSTTTTTPSTRLAGLSPGEYAFVVQWDREWFEPRITGRALETCIVERHFRLEAGQELDLGLLDADPGVVDFEFVLVDEAGAPIDVERAFPLTEAGSREQYILILHAAANVPTTASALKFDQWCGWGLGQSSLPMRLRGAPVGITALTAQARHDIGLVYESHSNWVPSGSTRHDFEPQRDRIVHVPITLLAQRPVKVTVLHTPPLDVPSTNPVRESLTVRRASDGRTSSLECAWSNDEPRVLVASGRLPNGVWTFASLLVYVREWDDSIRADFFLGPVFVAASAEWLWIGDSFEVTAHGAGTFALEARPAATLRFRTYTPSDDAVGVGSGERLPNLRGALEIAGEHNTWSPINLVISEAIEWDAEGAAIVRGLPPDRRLRLRASEFEFHTGPPGSTVEVVLPKEH